MIKKIAVYSFLFIILCGSIFYFSSTKLTKNKIKHAVLHKLGILNSEWKITTEKKNDTYIASFNSPTLLIDDIYNSMEGPYTYKRFKLDETKDELLWISRFQANANSKLLQKSVSNDFICHVNLYHNSAEHYSRMGINDKIAKQSDRQLISLLTTGSLNIEFPKGFAYPIFSNEKILIGSQALNLNKKDNWFNVDYTYKIHYSTQKKIKPLYMKYVVLAMPYKEGTSEEKESHDKLPYFVECALPSTERHKKENGKGELITSFWKVPKGKHTYQNDVTDILSLQKVETLHYINVHVHPYARSLELIDITTNTSVFKSIITNADGKKGIEDITSFSSIEGVKLYPNHQYNMILEVDNTSKIANSETDMMCGMFLYFYNEDFDKKLNNF